MHVQCLPSSASATPAVPAVVSPAAVLPVAVVPVPTTAVSVDVPSVVVLTVGAGTAAVVVLVNVVVLPPATTPVALLVLPALVPPVEPFLTLAVAGVAIVLKAGVLAIVGTATAVASPSNSLTPLSLVYDKPGATP
jgi:hypothetical protein